MSGLSDEMLKEQLSDAISRWDKCLLVISLPHAAALSAFLGRYDVKTDLTFSFYGLIIFLVSLSAWIMILYHRFSNEFLQSHPSAWTRFKAILGHFAFFFYPVGVFFVAELFEKSVDLVAMVFISGTLLSWFICALVAAGYLHDNLMKRVRDAR